MVFSFSKKLKLLECFKRYFAKLSADSLLSPRTIEKYLEVAKRIVDILGDISIKKLDGKIIQGLKIHLNQRNLSSSRKNHFLIVIRNLLQFLCEEEGLKVFDFRRIVKYKVPQKEVKYLSKEELLKLVNAPKKTIYTGLRMIAALWTIISTSLRVSELLSIKKKDINFETGILSTRTKGDKPHQAVLNQEAKKAIREYLAVRNDDNEYLFVTANKNKINQWSVGDFQRSLRNLGKKLGFKINITPHLVGRKSVATLMYKEGVPLGVIQAQLNHSSSQVTTKFYIGNLAFQDVLKHHKRVMNFDIESDSSEGGEKK
jgi:integrase/recombinase XerD